MYRVQLQKKIDQTVDELVGCLEKELGKYRASLTLAGSYVTGKMSLEKIILGVRENFSKVKKSKEMF